MQQIQINADIQADAAPFDLKMRLIARADEPGAAGQIGRLLRDTPDLLEIESDTRVVMVSSGCIALYGWRAMAALIAQLRPLKSTWLEVILGDHQDRIGCLCIGAGAGALEFYCAWRKPGQEVVAKPVYGLRAQTNWGPVIDWIALDNGTWSPSDAWLRRAGSWMASHYQGHSLESGIADDQGRAELHGVLLGSLMMAVALSPLVTPMPLATAA